MTIKLGLVGTGTVGGGCLDILRNHREMNWELLWQPS